MDSTAQFGTTSEQIVRTDHVTYADKGDTMTQIYCTSPEFIQFLEFI